MIVEIFGWIGSIIYIVAYYLISHNKIDKGKMYFLLNMIAAVLVSVISVVKMTIQPVFTNVFWLYVSYVSYFNKNLTLKFMNKKFFDFVLVIMSFSSIVSWLIWDYLQCFDILAWMSVVAFIWSYYLFSVEKINMQSFHLYNVIAAISVIPKMVVFSNYQVVCLEILWAIFAIRAYTKALKDKEYTCLSS